MSSGRRVAVAFSGGRDSTALLHATWRAAPPLGIEVLALHVQHGLHADADQWLAHCRRLCARWARSGSPLHFVAARLEGAPAAGQSVEAWARIARYQALGAMAREQRATLVLLAQHRRDQAETFLLQALRGGGVAGTAGMFACSERDGIAWARPWLQQPREAIEAYVRHHRLRFIDDGSNADLRFARNRLRAQVWPALSGAFEGAERALAEAAGRAAQARQLLDEVAAADLLQLERDHALDVEAWRQLSPLRRRNALLGWLRRAGIASAALVERLMLELPAARSARWPAGAGIELRLHRGALRIDANPRRPATNDAAVELNFDRPGAYPLPQWGGCLVVRRVRRNGIAATSLAALHAEPRSGGETFQLAPRSTPRSLKKQFQSLGVPAWQRDGPLLFAGERLVFAAGLGIDARVRAAAGDEQFSLRWVPDR